MAEGSYEDECMRAELMGSEKPDYDEFVKRKQAEAEAHSEKLEIQQLQEAEAQNDEHKATASKFDELNTILSKTQKKINKVKHRFGSVSEMFKSKFGSPSKSSKSKTTEDRADNELACNDTCQTEAQETATVKETNVNINGTSGAPRKSELSKALDYNMDKLDLLLDGAERAEISMSHQNKQMKKYINKK